MNRGSSPRVETKVFMAYANKEQQREYQKNWIAKRRSNYFLGKMCVDCGSKLNLEIDHVDPSQKISHKIWSWSNNKMLEELDKCVIRCHDCHKVKTTKERFVVHSHGTFQQYQSYKCRCSLCRAANAAYRRNRRARGLN